jgi:hypothetical protein
MKRTVSQKITFFALILSSVLLIYSCNRETLKSNIELQHEPVVTDTLSFSKAEKIIPKLKINYRLDSISSAAQLDSLKASFSEDELRIIYAINRVDPHRVRKGRALLIPDTLINDLNVYSPFPDRLKMLDSIPKTVLINQRIQGFALYEAGKMVKWGPISSGKRSTATPNGLNYGNYKAVRKVSTVDSDWILPYYFNFMNYEGIGVHQYELPGYPASHGCVRLKMDDAKYIFDWASQWDLNRSSQKIIKNGTPFMVFGEYDYKEAAPWLELAKDSNANNLTATELNELTKYIAAYKKDPKNFDPITDDQDLQDLAAK